MKNIVKKYKNKLVYSLLITILLITMIFFFSCKPEPVMTPTFNPVGGTYTEVQSVTILCATEGATIRFTMDESDPSSTVGTVYSTPIVISTTTTLKAIAYKDGMADSTIATATYTINIPQVATPTFNPVGGTYTGVQSVTILCITDGAEIRYTTDGNDPTSTTGTIYSTPVSISENTTLKAIAYKTGWSDSDIASDDYEIQVATPTFSLTTGTYNQIQSVTISCADTNATIRYTTDGSTPTSTTGTIYSSLINVYKTTTINAIAYKSGMADSEIGTEIYTFVFSVALAGSYDTSGNAYGVYVVGDYAYVADIYAGLQIIDISTPSSPSLAGSYDTSGNAYGVYVLGDYAYVADYDYGLQIIDISTPSSPSLAGSYDTSVSAQGIYVVDNYAYVADEMNGLQIIDISTPSSPSLAGSYDTSGNAYGVYLLGDYVYIADYLSGLQIINISTTSSPSLAGSYDTSGEARGIYVVDNYAYVSDRSSGLQIINISTPSSPSLAGSYDTSGYARGVYVVDNYAYVADGDSGLVILSLTLP